MKPNSHDTENRRKATVFCEEFQTAIREGKPLEYVCELLQRAIRELEQDFVAYRSEISSKAHRGRRGAA